MDIVRDEREEMINKLCLYVQSVSDQEVGSIKSSLYILLNEYEIINRSTELAEVQTDRNEYLLKSFLIAKKSKRLHGADVAILQDGSEKDPGEDRKECGRSDHRRYPVLHGSPPEPGQGVKGDYRQ